MANLLIVAEKPSVARSIASAIGLKKEKKHEGYIEGFSDFFGYTVWVTWCLGHLVQMSYPESYDSKYAKWSLEDLPLIPEEFKYEVIPETRKQFEIVAKLMNSVGESELDKKEISTLSEDKKFLVPVDGLVNACDAGREGELIFRLVYEQAKCKKPFERLWISSMEDKAISDGFSNLRKGPDYDALYEAALCRERADWIVGMNATRLFSTLYGQTLNVGRVMTPTLAMMVEREAEIEGFKPKPFYRLSINVAGVTALGERIIDKELSKNLLNNLNAEGKATVSKLDTSDKKESAPQLYSLTALQRDANKILGFTAQQTLDYTQSLYEKKLVTYPRTDSRFLTEDMESMIPDLARKLSGKFGYTKGLQVNARQVINNKKVSDHHAIIPTENVADAVFGELPSGEQKVLSLITARFLAALGDAAIKQETEVEFTCAEQVFKAKATLQKEKGYKEIQEWIMGSKSEGADSENDNEEQSENAGSLDYISSLTNGKSYPMKDPKIVEGKTTPKKHFTEDSLLSAMERAGADELSDEVERKGIGTSATRAATIEKLVRIGFVERKGDKKTKYLYPTHKGVALITVMPEQIQSPSMTAEWEEKLLDVEKGTYEKDAFMDGIEEMITDLVKTYKIIEDAEVLMHPAYEEIGICPCCGKHVVEKQKGYFCEEKECRFALWKENRFFEALGKKMTKQIATKLLKDGKVSLKGCKSAKTGKNYDTTVVMKVDESQRAVFELNFDKGGK